MANQAERNAAAIQAAVPAIVENFHADQYTVWRRTTEPDGYGGRVTTWTDVEAGRCFFRPESRQGAVRGGGFTAVPTAPYSADLPLTADIQVGDQLVINGRPFRLTDPPQRGGAFGTFTFVTLEDWDDALHD